MTFDKLIDPDVLRRLVSETVAETLRQTRELDAAGDVLTEDEAAEILRLEPHQLADERRRGRISASRITGRRIRYLRQDVLDYLLSRRVQAKG